MKHYITVHWPMLEEETGENNSVYFPDNRDQLAAALSVGDRVFIYESRSGRKVLGQSNNFRIGRKGVISCCEITALVNVPVAESAERYVDGTEIKWIRRADMQVETSGFVPLSFLNDILEYKPNYNWHGFGKKHCGTRAITEQQSAKIKEILLRSQSELSE